MMAEHARPVTGGIDTHKDTHLAAVIDSNGTVLATEAFPNHTTGHRQLGEWLRSHGPVAVVGVEGTGSYGAGIRRHLGTVGLDVVEVNRPDRSARRRAGKSDPLDAIAAARAALSGGHAGPAKTSDGPVEAIRMLRICRRSALQSRTKTANQIHALVDTAPADLHDQLAPKTLAEIVNGVAPGPTGPLSSPAGAAIYSLELLTARWHALTTEITELDNHLDRLVANTAPDLVTCTGFGTDTVGALLVAAGDNPDRLRNEASFAALCGVAPLPASSGRTTRHRLNRGGNRDANRALWVVALVRMRHHQPTRNYVERRTTEGLSKREIMRCLKRYIARQAYPHLRHLR